MVNYKIIPYDRSHTDEILTFGINDKLLENDTNSEEGRIDYGIPGLSFTLLADDSIVLCGGITPLWDGVAEGWVMASQNIFEMRFLAAKTMKQLTDDMCKKNKIKRLQTSVKADFKLGVRFATWLGLEIEGTKKCYGPDGSDYYQLGKIY